MVRIPYDELLSHWNLADRPLDIFRVGVAANMPPSVLLDICKWSLQDMPHVGAVKYGMHSRDADI